MAKIEPERGKPNGTSEIYALASDGTGEATVLYPSEHSTWLLNLAPDGEHFIINRGDPQLRKHFGIRVVFNWAERLAGAGR